MVTAERMDCLMKQSMKVLVVVSLVFIAVMLMESVASSEAYDFRNISNNSTGDWYPQINTNGQVVWEGRGIEEKIFLYRDGVVSNLTNNGTQGWYPQINASGQVVWQASDGSDWEIFLYRDGVVSKLTNNSIHDWYPKISDTGQVVWQGYDLSKYDIFLYRDGVVSKLGTDGANNTRPQINASGQVVWQGNKDTNYGIFLFQDGAVSQLGINGARPQINRSGQVVWQGHDGTDWEIFLYRDGVVTQLTTDDIQEYDPQINDSGHVVWRGWSGIDYKIFLYQDGFVSQIWTDGFTCWADWYDWRPQINNSGQILWQARDVTDSEIFLYQDGAVSQLTINSTDDWQPRMNDSGQVVWVGWDGNDYEVYLRTPIPDIEVAPSEIHFGDVAVGESTTAIVTIDNMGSSDLNVSCLSFASGGGKGVSILPSPGLPGTIVAGASVEVTLEFAPTEVGPASETLDIVSNDPDSPLVHVAIDGNGLPTDLPPTQQIADLLAFYDYSITHGTLYGAGSGNSALNRQTALRNMIVAARNHISEGDNTTAIEQLQDILIHCDNVKQGDQFVDGPNLARLAEKVQALITALQSEV